MKISKKIAENGKTFQVRGGGSRAENKKEIYFLCSFMYIFSLCFYVKETVNSREKLNKKETFLFLVQFIYEYNKIKGICILNFFNSVAFVYSAIFMLFFSYLIQNKDKIINI